MGLGALANGASSSNGDTSSAVPRLLVWSAPDRNGLERLVALHQTHLRSVYPNGGNHEYIQNLAYTLSKRRSCFTWRAFQVLRSLSEVDGGSPKIPSAQSIADRSPRLAFIFTGQGSQWPTMGLELVSYPDFKQSLETAERHFHRLGASWSLIGMQTSVIEQNLD